MSVLIQVKDIHKSYGSNVIFDGASALFAANDRIGCIGRNGAGKSTLCKLILGDEELDDGELLISPRCRLGYLEQKNPYRDDEAVLDFLLRHSGLEEWQCGKVAGRFQLKGDVLKRQVSQLPGGFQTRVKLAAMLLKEPNFLILDEPTNFLDLKTLLLLEAFLRDFRGGYLIVSHDREFLKKTCSHTIEAGLGKLTLFPGDVESYLAAREEELEHTERYNKNVAAERKNLERFVARYRVRASTASRAQSKLKQLEKLKTIDIAHPMKTARIRIPDIEAKKGVALKLEGLEIGYADTSVASDIHFEIERGQHVAVLGDNGAGKTTLLRTLAADLEPRNGELGWGFKLSCGYYAQHVYRAIGDDMDVYQYLEGHLAPGLTQQDVLDMAGAFLFRGDDVRKPVGVLSGGERARLCLAGLLLTKHPVLLLDEPTNHLDFETVEALGNALRNYNGTIFFVSHDRTFVNLVATNIVEVRDGAVVLYPGDYGHYVYRVEEEIERAAKEDAPSSSETPAKSGSNYERRKERRARHAKLKKEIQAAETRLAAHQEEREKLNQHFLDNPLDVSTKKQKRVAELDKLVAEDENNWIRFQEEFEELRSDDG